MTFIEKRTPTRFTEKLSLFMASVAALGAFFVLADPTLKVSFLGQELVIAAKFSADLKGLVIGAILIGGWNSIKEYWLGASDQGARAQESVNVIAKASAPATAAAVAAATGAPAPAQPAAPIQADTINVDATTANVTEKGNP